MRCAIHLLLSTVHHFRIGKRPGLARLFGFVQVFRLRDEGRNDSPSYYLYVLEHIAENSLWLWPFWPYHLHLG